MYAGDSVTLSCDIPESNPPARVSMHKKGEETELSENNLRYRVCCCSIKTVQLNKFKTNTIQNYTMIVDSTIRGD